jgi:hypothetical protein
MSFAGGSADVATRVAVVPWLCVTAFRRLCSEQLCCHDCVTQTPGQAPLTREYFCVRIWA